MFGKLEMEEVEALLHQNILGRLGCHADNVTYVVPMSYAYDGHNIYGISKEGMKLDMMRKNPAVCFEVEETGNMSNWKSVIAWGDFSELTEPEERKKALEVLLHRELPLLSSKTTHLSGDWPFSPGDLNDIKGVVFSIRLTRKTGRFEKNTVRF